MYMCVKTKKKCAKMRECPTPQYIVCFQCNNKYIYPSSHMTVRFNTADSFMDQFTFSYLETMLKSLFIYIQIPKIEDQVLFILQK